MEPKKVLFVCIHNSARSQMAETFLNTFGNGAYIAESAGLEPGKLNPLVIEVMKEEGFDISENKTKSVFEFFKSGKLFNYVITVCDLKNAEKCPVFPGITKRIEWSFADPSAVTGTDDEKLEKVRKIRDEIKNQINEWLKDTGDCSRQ